MAARPVPWDGSDHSPDPESKKSPYKYQQHDTDAHIVNPQGLSDPNDANHSLHRGLSSRQISMIAIGGALGTGLIVCAEPYQDSEMRQEC
jgi:amino acid transporter